MNPPPLLISFKAAAIFAIVAFAAGAAVCWLLMQQLGVNPGYHADISNDLPTYVAEQPQEAAPARKPASAEPDVSTLSPVEAAISLGNWNYDQQNWTMAIEKYQRAIALGADNPDVQTDLGNAYRFSGNAMKALEHYQVARRENPQHENSLFNMATLYDLVLKDPDNALRTWQDYLTRFPNGEKAAAAREYIAKSGSKTP